MPDQPLATEQLLTLLAATPEHIAASTAGLPPAQLQVAPIAGEWSANAVLAHLRACADMWGGCIAAMLAQNSPTIRAVNPRSWIKRTDYLEQEFLRSLEAFAAQRTKLLSTLEPLDPAGWARAAVITGAGKPLVRTVQFYAQWLVRHEQPHIKQIERIVQSHS